MKKIILFLFIIFNCSVDLLSMHPLLRPGDKLTSDQLATLYAPITIFGNQQLRDRIMQYKRAAGNQEIALDALLQINRAGQDLPFSNPLKNFVLNKFTGSKASDLATPESFLAFLKKKVDELPRPPAPSPATIPPTKEPIKEPTKEPAKGPDYDVPPLPPPPSRPLPPPTEEPLKKPDDAYIPPLPPPADASLLNQLREQFNKITGAKNLATRYLTDASKAKNVMVARNQRAQLDNSALNPARTALEKIEEKLDAAGKITPKKADLVAAINKLVVDGKKLIEEIVTIGKQIDDRIKELEAGKPVTPKKEPIKVGRKLEGEALAKAKKAVEDAQKKINSFKAVLDAKAGSKRHAAVIDTINRLNNLRQTAEVYANDDVVGYLEDLQAQLNNLLGAINPNQDKLKDINTLIGEFEKILKTNDDPNTIITKFIIGRIGILRKATNEEEEWE